MAASRRDQALAFATRLAAGPVAARDSAVMFRWLLSLEPADRAEVNAATYEMELFPDPVPAPVAALAPAIVPPVAARRSVGAGLLQTVLAKHPQGAKLSAALEAARSGDISQLLAATAAPADPRPLPQRLIELRQSFEQMHGMMSGGSGPLASLLAPLGAPAPSEGKKT